jgi:hypothetical protein
MEQVDKNEVTDRCMWCHKRGGREVIDPYREEIYGERVVVRLHEDCERELADEI